MPPDPIDRTERVSRASEGRWSDTVTADRGRAPQERPTMDSPNGILSSSDLEGVCPRSGSTAGILIEASQESPLGLGRN
jgi:hypothetical protein